MEILVFCYGNLIYNPQKIDRKDKERVKYAYSDNGKRDGYGLFCDDDRFIDDKIMRLPSSYIEFDVERGLHPTQKPVSLYQYLIRTYTNPGDTVMDFCFGSGTTLVAARNNGRRAIGIEISEDFCKIAVDRLRQQSLFSIKVEKPKTTNLEQKSFL